VLSTFDLGERESGAQSELEMNEKGRAEDTATLASLRAALDAGIAELDAGLGVEVTPEELTAEVFAELGLES